MLQTVKDVCELHPMALDYAMGDQIEHLSDLLDEAEKSAEDFFAKNYVTAGMRVLLRQGLERLSGKSDQGEPELHPLHLGHPVELADVVHVVLVGLGVILAAGFVGVFVEHGICLRGGRLLHRGRRLRRGRLLHAGRWLVDS